MDKKIDFLLTRYRLVNIQLIFINYNNNVTNNKLDRKIQ